MVEKPVKNLEPVVQAIFTGHVWKHSWGLRLRLAAGFVYQNIIPSH